MRVYKREVAAYSNCYDETIEPYWPADIFNLSGPLWCCLFDPSLSILAIHHHYIF